MAFLIFIALVIIVLLITFNNRNRSQDYKPTQEYKHVNSKNKPKVDVLFKQIVPEDKRVTHPSRRIHLGGERGVFFDTATIYETDKSYELEQLFDDINSHFTEESKRLRKNMHDINLRKVTSDRLQEQIRYSSGHAWSGCKDPYKYQLGYDITASKLCKLVEDLFVTGYVILK